MIRHSSFIIPLTSFILSCAHQTPPQGGPLDTEPPNIVSTYPAPYTTHFDDNRIAFEFDEHVDKRTAEESIFISPYVGDLEFDWTGTEVEVLFAEPLRRNTTYVVNVGTDVKDLNNGNRMAQAFTLAFSTGADIDRGGLQGRVLVEKDGDSPEGVMMFAYHLESLNADTLNPRTLKPDYITQTGKGGDFFFRHVALGAYRIFAVKDEYRNLLYDPEADEFGLPSSDIRLTPTDTMTSGLLLRLSREDTTMPRLIKAAARDWNHVVVEFSEPLHSASISDSSFFIIDTLSGRNLQVVSSFSNPLKPESFTIVTHMQDSLKGYRFIVNNATDSTGNPINPTANSLSFAGSAQADTLGLRLGSSTIRDSSRQIPLTPEILIFLTDGAQRENPAEWIEFRDSLKNVIPMSIRWLNDATLMAVPQPRLAGLMWHRLSIDMRAVKNWNGEPSNDTLRTIRFETLDADALSSIEGTVLDRNPAGKGKVFVRAESVGARGVSGYTTTIAGPGNFSLQDIEQGRYVLSIFRDEIGNGIFDAGKPFPYRPSERLAVYPDTLKLRARWPVEGVRIELR